ncbi:MAG: cysteine--tRNA ligase [candidate division KSB1 bacterium]|nr:cysteine--tRNA ligase [candidate division KSB1 bacterium]
MPLKIYNTLTREKEEFVPVNPGRVGFYLCGPTVYDYFHIGNARPFVVFDVFRRYLRYRGHHVRFVMNITDIDDKIIQRANELGIPAHEVAQKYTTAFFEDIQKLGVQPADVYPKATEHIDDIIRLIETLVAKGYAYVIGGEVYYDVSKFSDYAKLSGKKLEELRAGERVAIDERKDDPLDFALWKAAKPGEPWWESPWGKGRPGWHAECSVMSMKYLGETIDFHAGGMDLIFPHHENEIAQSEAATGKPFVKYWLHNGFLDIDGEKMSKSLGNFRTAREVLAKFPTTAVRLFFLMKHYRGPISFSPEPLEHALKARERLNIAYDLLRRHLRDPNTLQSAEPGARHKAQLTSSNQQRFAELLVQSRHDFITAMDDDFNTPKALAVIFDLIRETNRLAEQPYLSQEERFLLAEAKNLLEEWNSFFGVIDTSGASVDQARLETIIQILLEVRQNLRDEKNFKMADYIRSRLKDAGIVIEDSSQASRWRWE